MGPAGRPATIVVTRPAGREQELCERLRALGHRVLHVPLVAVEPLGDEPVAVDGYDWVVLTSVVGAQELRRRMTGTPRKVAAIGRATAEAFGGADVVASTSTQEGLLAALPDDAGRVLFAGAEGARRLLPETLGADVVVLYRTRAARARALARLRPRRARLAVGRHRIRLARVGDARRVDRAGDDAGRARGGRRGAGRGGDE